MSVNVKYRTQATATGGGREGHAKTHDSVLDVKLVTPKELGGSGGEGVNPEQLFATGYSACFLGAMRFVAAQDKIDLPSGATVTADVGIGPRSDFGFGLDVKLTIDTGDLDASTADALIAKAHEVCPYSHATRGNINVDVSRKA